MPADRAWPNRPSAAAPSMTASSPRGCATAAASPPTRSTASAASWRSSAARAASSRCIERARDAPPRRRSTAAARSPPRAAAPSRRRSAAQFPLLRQPAEISAVRQYLQREVGSRAPRLRRARASPSAAAGGARVRRRRRRRLGAGARDARDARPLHPHAVLHRRQGDQPRGRAADAAEDVGPLLRASGDGAGADQSRLRGCAVACGEVAQRRLEHGLARAAAGRQFGAPLRAADHGSRAVPGAELEGRRQPAHRQSGLRAAGRAGASIARTTASCSIRSFRSPAARSPITISSSPRSLIARALRSNSRPSA